MGDDRAPRSLTLHTDDGVSLEAELAVPDEPFAAALLTHPHPLHGGSMRSLVTSELFRTLPGEGIAALRFNFRGVEGSTGAYGEGRAEQVDVVAGLDELAADIGGVPVFCAGWSFGADVSLSVVEDRLAGWFCVAPPLRLLPPEELVAARDPRPKRLAVPEHDQFCPPAVAAERTSGWAATTIDVVSGADHFCVGRTDRVAALCVDFARSLRPVAR